MRCKKIKTNIKIWLQTTIKTAATESNKLLTPFGFICFVSFAVKWVIMRVRIYLLQYLASVCLRLFSGRSHLQICDYERENIHTAIVVVVARYVWFLHLLLLCSVASVVLFSVFVVVVMLCGAAVILFVYNRYSVHVARFLLVGFLDTDNFQRLFLR